MADKTFTYKQSIPKEEITPYCPVKEGETIFLYNQQAAKQPAMPMPFTVVKFDVSDDIAMGWDVLVENSLGFRMVLLFDRGGWIGFSMRTNWATGFVEDDNADSN